MTMSAGDVVLGHQCIIGAQGSSLLTSRLRGQLLVENFGCSIAMLPQDPVSAIDSAGTRSERFVRESEEPSSQRP